MLCMIAGEVRAESLLAACASSSRPPAGLLPALQADTPASPQGILDTFLREPLSDWQREARVLQSLRKPKTGSAAPQLASADAYIAEKVLAWPSAVYCLCQPMPHVH